MDDIDTDEKQKEECTSITPAADQLRSPKITEQHSVESNQLNLAICTAAHAAFIAMFILMPSRLNNNARANLY